MTRSTLRSLLVAVSLVAASTVALSAAAQPAPPPPGPPGASPLASSWQGAVQVVRVQGGGGAAEERARSEIFPDASKAWIHVTGTDPRPIEAARRGLRPWICSSGCQMNAAPTDAPPGTFTNTEMGRVAANAGDAFLRSIKLQTSAQPLPLTIWRPIDTGSRVTRGDSISGATTTGQLMFDPALLAPRMYHHVCAYPPIDATKGQAKSEEEVPLCHRKRAPRTAPGSAEIRLGFRWPRTSELAHFQYLAITDMCGNSRVQPFQRTFNVPVQNVVTGGCGRADGRVLRIFPAGGWVRVTAFNLDQPAAGSVVSATFRVTVPPLEDLVSANTPPMLFPDPRLNDLRVDCGPRVLSTKPKRRGAPGQNAPPGYGGKKGPPGQKAPPGYGPGSKKKGLPGQTAPPGYGPKSPGPGAPGGRPPKALPSGPPSPDPAAPPSGPPPSPGDALPPKTPGPNPGDDPPTGAPKGKAAPTKAPPIVRRQTVVMPTNNNTGQPLAHQSLVIAPEPLFQGNCRIEMRGQTKHRLVAPLALRVRIVRTDIPGTPILVDAPWIVTPSDSTFRLPPLNPQLFDGESRLRLEVLSDPLSGDGNVVLLSDAGRVARIENVALTQPNKLQRLIGSVTIHSAPLCGESNFESAEDVGSCLRGYFTIPAMLATLQITRAPWVERPLITRSILSAVGVAFALDSYDPVERRAFPIALQVGGFVQDLGENRLGLLSYVGLAPTLPILGEGGNTTSIGLLGGLGVNYITRSDGPDEGFKPAAFLSIVVQVGQANPSVGGGAAAFGSYQAPQANSGGGTF